MFFHLLGHSEMSESHGFLDFLAHSSCGWSYVASAGLKATFQMWRKPSVSCLQRGQWWGTQGGPHGPDPWIPKTIDTRSADMGSPMLQIHMHTQLYFKSEKCSQSFHHRSRLKMQSYNYGVVVVGENQHSSNARLLQNYLDKSWHYPVNHLTMFKQFLSNTTYMQRGSEMSMCGLGKNTVPGVMFALITGWGTVLGGIWKYQLENLWTMILM